MSEQSACSSGGSAALVYIKRRHGTILLHAGHQYHTKIKHKSGLTVWQCTQRSICKGIMRIKNGDILEQTPHSCTADFTRNELEEKLYKLKQQITTPEFPSVPTQYNSMVSTLKDSGVALICNIPNFVSVKSQLYRHRNDVANVSKLQCRKVEEVEVPPKYKEFLLADFASDNLRILAFASEQARRTLCEIDEFYGDGTFKSCPAPFDELYTIHGDLGSTVNHTNIVPLVYALISNRNAESYIILFRLIKATLPGWNPKKFKIDYEKAVIKAVAEELPSTELKGCYYHYNKAIWAKGRDLGMARSEEPRHVRMVSLSAVLPLLPQNEIMNGWQYITHFSRLFLP